MPERMVGYAKNGKISRKLSKEMQRKLQSAKDKLHHGQQYRAHIREEHWRKSIAQYENKTGFDVQSTEDMDLINVNLSFSTINTLVPFVSDENPRFMVDPYSGDASAEHASLLELMLNRLWRDPEVEGQSYVAASVWDWLVQGDGYVQVGYELIEDDQYTEKGDTLSGRGQERIKYTVESVSPWDLWIDPYASGIHNARWVCRRVLFPVEELRNDDRFKFIDPLDAGSDVVASNYAEPTEFQRLAATHEDDGWVAVFEFYNIKEKWMLSFIEDSEYPIRYVEGIKCPILQNGNYRISNSPYHIGELEMIHSLQMEMNRTRSEMITHRRRNTAKWMVRKDMVSQEALSAMRSNVINDIIPIEGNVPFSQIVEQIEPQQLNPDAYQQDDVIRNDINEITGVSDYLRGQGQGSASTATEAQIIEGATNVKTRHKLNQVETFLRRIGQALLDTIADTLPLTDFEEMRMYVTGTEAERLLRSQGAEDTNTDAIFTPSPEIFEGRFVVEVERGSAELRNPMHKEQQAKEMFQIITSSMPIFQQFGVSVNLKAYLEEWMRAANIDDLDRFFQDDEQQHLMQEAALQQQLMASQPQQGGSTEEVATGSATPQGSPRPQAAAPPGVLINETNSGMLPARPA